MLINNDVFQKKYTPKSIKILSLSDIFSEEAHNEIVTTLNSSNVRGIIVKGQNISDPEFFDDHKKMHFGGRYFLESPSELLTQEFYWDEAEETSQEAIQAYCGQDFDRFRRFAASLGVARTTIKFDSVAPNVHPDLALKNVKQHLERTNFYPNICHLKHGVSITQTMDGLSTVLFDHGDDAIMRAERSENHTVDTKHLGKKIVPEVGDICILKTLDWSDPLLHVSSEERDRLGNYLKRSTCIAEVMGQDRCISNP